MACPSMARAAQRRRIAAAGIATAGAAKPAADNSSFLTKLGRKLKSLVSGS